MGNCQGCPTPVYYNKIQQHSKVVDFSPSALVTHPHSEFILAHVTNKWLLRQLLEIHRAGLHTFFPDRPNTYNPSGQYKLKSFPLLGLHHSNTGFRVSHLTGNFPLKNQYSDFWVLTLWVGDLRPKCSRTSPKLILGPLEMSFKSVHNSELFASLQSKHIYIKYNQKNIEFIIKH